MSVPAAVRSLPIRLAPTVGESLDSWLFAYAIRLETPLADFAAATGLGEGFLRQPARSIALGSNLPDVHQAAEATGVEPEAVTRMWSPLARYSRVVRARFAGSSLRDVAFPLAWSRFCPPCLAVTGDRWQVSWRLPWHTNCPVHRVLLLDVCPACGAKQRFRPLPGVAISLGPAGRCTGVLPGARGRRPMLCGHDLSAAPTSGGDQAAGSLHLRGALGPALDPDASDSALANAVDILANVSVIAAHLGGDHSAAVRGFGRSAELAGSLTHAWALFLRADDVELADLVAPDMAGGTGVMPPSWRLAGSSLTTRIMRLRDASMRPTDRLRWRSTTTPRRPGTDGSGQATARARCCPEAMWPDWTIRLMPNSGVSAASFRAVAAAALRLPGSTAPLADLLAGTCHDGLGREVSRVLARSGDGVQTSAVLRAITSLAGGLDAYGSPIDYERRRRLVSSSELLSGRDWDRICAHAGTPTGQDRKLSNARLWLYEALTGGPLQSAPPAIRPDDHGVGAYHQFALRLPPLAADLLERHGADILANLDIDEPLTWSPPREWVNDHGLPGPEPDDIDPIQVNRLLQARVAPAVVATRLGISLEHLRHVVRRHQPEVRPRASGTFRNRSTLPAELTPERLRQLVVDEGQSLRHLASEFGVDRKSIASALERESIPIGPSGRKPMAVDGDWLRAQYFDQGRPLPELARELGTTPTSVARAAKAHGIVLRGRGGASHARNLAPPSPVLPLPLALALAGDGGLERVRRYQVLARCRSLCQAATEISCDQPTLHAQLRRLERGCGALIVRSTRSHQPQRLTRLGRALLEQADEHLGRPSPVQEDVPEPLAAALAAFRGEGRVRRFLEVAEADSIAQAARLLGAHKTTLSKQILRLEVACGGLLLHRRTAPDKPHSLTELGQLLVQQAAEHFRSAA